MLTRTINFLQRSCAPIHFNPFMPDFFQGDYKQGQCWTRKRKGSRISFVTNHLKINSSQSELLIRMNPRQSVTDWSNPVSNPINPSQSEFGFIQIETDWFSNDLQQTRLKTFFGLVRNNSKWISIRNFHQTIQLKLNWRPLNAEL